MQEPYVRCGKDCEFQTGSVIGHRYKEGCGPFVVGNAARIRTGSIIYGDVYAGDDFQTGHNVLIREQTRFGNHIVVGSNTVVEGKGGFGYNANTDTYEDLLKAGVLDPAKVTRIALQNAASIAGLLLTTDCLVTEKPTEKEAMPPGGPGGDPGMGGMGGMGGMM